MIGYIVLGLAAGALSGMVGIGGGIIIVPALVFFFGLSQQQAQGTTLALLLPPIGVFAAWKYYQRGFIDLKIAGLVIIGFVVGSALAAAVAVDLPTRTLQRIFGAVLLGVSIKMLMGK